MTLSVVVVVGLGPGGPDLLTGAALRAIEAVPTGRRFLRTVRHPAATAVAGATSFDPVYDAADRQEDVYPAIVDRLVAAASAGAGPVLYAVPGSPRVAERSVDLLLADGRVAVEVVAGLSFLDLAWARLGVDPVQAGVRLVDGSRFGVEAAGERGPLLVSHCHDRSVLSAVKVALDELPTEPVTVLQRLGLPDERVAEVAWSDLDRPGVVEPDHLTSLWVPSLAAPVAVELVRFEELVRRLRDECPWDRKQTHASLTRHLLEESYEVLEAIEGLDVAAGTGYDHLEEELGDLLFQVAFHARLAAEAGQFTMADVARNVHDKLVGRHPHVFGDVSVDGADDVVRNWEQLKKAEKGRASIMDGIPGNLPALLYAAKVQRKAASLGIEEDGAPEAVTEAEVGDALYRLVGVARRAGVDPESALRAATARARDAARATEASQATQAG